MKEREAKGKGGKHPRLFKTNKFSVLSNNDQTRPLAFESPATPEEDEEEEEEDEEEEESEPQRRRDP